MLPHFCMKELKKLSRCITFLSHNVVDVYRAKCDCRCARKRRAAQQGSNDEQCHAPRTFARGVGLECENCRVWLKGVLVEQDSEVHVVSVHPELIGDVRDMVTGFLKDNCMKLTTGSRGDVGGISARRAWIPL